MPYEMDEKLEFYFFGQFTNINTSEGSINWNVFRSGSVKYPHTRVFTEVQLGFILDANLSLLKFFNAWQDLCLMKVQVELNSRTEMLH